MSKELVGALKNEIVRIARKELRAETESLKRASARYRSEIAALKREVSELRRELGRAAKGSKANGEHKAADIEGDQEIKVRFSAKSLISQRKRLGLSAEQFGKLVGVSGQSIYNWEAEKARPRAQQLVAFASVRHIGRREAQARLGVAGEA